MRAAEVVGRIVESFLGPAPPLHVTCWDDSTWGDERARFRVRINGPSALRRLLWDPNELGLGRAHVAGELDFDGSIFEEISSTHYGRMVHLDDKTILFASPEDAAEFIGFDLTASS